MNSIDESVSRVLERVARLPAIDCVVLVGSYARGEPAANSDIDFVALVDGGAPWPVPVRDGGREASVSADGRQVELAFISDRRVRAKMAAAEASGRGYEVDWLIEAKLLSGPGELFGGLRTVAHEILVAGPKPLPDQELRWRCYELWNALKDVEDKLDDPDSATRLAFSTLENFVLFAFQWHRAWQPRPKEVLNTLRGVDTDIYRLAIRFVREQVAEDRYADLVAMRNHFEGLTGLPFDASYTSGPATPMQ